MWGKGSIFLVCVPLSLFGCVPLGKEIDPEISRNHYFAWWGFGVIYGQAGNCLSLGCTEIEGAEAKSFRPLSAQYGQDARAVFYKAQRLEGESPASFQYLGGFYARGARGAYFSGKIFPVEDPESFRAVVFRGGGRFEESYALDDSAVYCRDQKLSERPARFRLLGRGNYFTDDESVYFLSGGVCHRFEAAAASFTFLSYPDGSAAPYARDARFVYRVPGTSRVQEADAASFMPLCDLSGPEIYAVDAEHVFLRDKIREGADPKTYPFPVGCQLP